MYRVAQFPLVSWNGYGSHGGVQRVYTKTRLPPFFPVRCPNPPSKVEALPYTRLLLQELGRVANTLFTP